MSMLSLTGQVLNVLEVPKGTKKDGTAFGGYHQVQLLCEEPLKNGELRMQLFTLSTETPDAFQDAVGRSVTVPVGVFAKGGSIHFYMLKTPHRAGEAG
jgi:hypothetical protein